MAFYIFAYGLLHLPIERIANKMYLKNIQNNLISNPSSFWSYVNSLRKNHQFPSIMKHDSDQVDIIFGLLVLLYFFSNVYVSNDFPIEPSMFDSNVKEHIQLGRLRFTSN